MERGVAKYIALLPYPTYDLVPPTFTGRQLLSLSEYASPKLVQASAEAIRCAAGFRTHTRWLDGMHGGKWTDWISHQRPKEEN